MAKSHSKTNPRRTLGNALAYTHKCSFTYSSGRALKRTFGCTPEHASKRSRVITSSGYLFIATNFLLGIFNLIVGLIANSLAITSDAIHSFVDSVSGFLIIISEKLARHHKLSGHRQHIERITTILIALIIIAVGVHIFVESVEAIFSPEVPDYSVPVTIVLVVSVILKYALARYLKRTGQKVNSTVLTASGVETINDAWISVAVLVSAIIYLIWQVDLEAYISIIISLIIARSGLEFIFPHLSHHHHHHLESDPDHDHCNRK